MPQAKEKIKDHITDGSVCWCDPTIVHVSPYVARLKVMGKTYEGNGETLIEAIGNLKPELARGVSILTIEKGSKKQERILNRVKTSRLFGLWGGVHKEIAHKQISAMFDL